MNHPKSPVCVLLLSNCSVRFPLIVTESWHLGTVVLNVRRSYIALSPYFVYRNTLSKLESAQLNTFFSSVTRKRKHARISHLEYIRGNSKGLGRFNFHQYTRNQFVQHELTELVFFLVKMGHKLVDANMLTIFSGLYRLQRDSLNLLF